MYLPMYLPMYRMVFYHNSMTPKPLEIEIEFNNSRDCRTTISDLDFVSIQDFIYNVPIK